MNATGEVPEASSHAGFGRNPGAAALLLAVGHGHCRGLTTGQGGALARTLRTEGPGGPSRWSQSDGRRLRWVRVGREAGDGGARRRQPLSARAALKAFIKRSQTLPVLQASALDDVVVARSGDCPKVFRFRRRLCPK